MSPRRYEFHTLACSGETTPNRNWCLPSVSALLNGVGLFGIRPSPASECWPELSARMDAILRRTKARRRYGFRVRSCSGEANFNRNWCLPPVSALLDGVALFGIHLPPASECWPELSADSHAVLRRTNPNRRKGSPPRTCSGEANPNRNWRLPPVSAPLNGVGLFGIHLPPASECWPELSADSHAVLRRTNPNRRKGSPPRACSGEANPNGSWRLPPVSALLNGVELFGIHLPPASECWPELSARSHAILRRTNPNRRTESPPGTCSGETTPNRCWCFPPVSAPLKGVGLFGIHLPPASKC